jgi:RNA polymerase sigma-70 factor (ECF subfamily)
MEASVRLELEREVREAARRGDVSAAVTRTLRGYGPELLGFLMAMHPNEADASDAFSEVSEALWRGLSTFAWDSSLRTWLYAVVWNVMRTNRRNVARRERRGRRVGDSELEQVALQVRTETLTFLRTEKRTRLQALRDALPEEDRLLLVLRIDRQLPWDDLARVMAETEPGAALDGAALTRESARLRKRLQLVKERLRDLAKKEGLLR